MFCQFDHYVLAPGNGTLSCYLLGQIFIYEYTVQFLQTYWCSIDVFQTFSVDKGFFPCFLLTNRTIVVFEEFLIFLFDDKLQYLYLIHLHQSYLKLQLLSPQVCDHQHHQESQWFQGYYFDQIVLMNCCFLPVRLLFFSRLLILLYSLWFSTCKSLIITSFKFSISLSKLSKRNNNLLSRLIIIRMFQGYYFHLKLISFAWYCNCVMSFCKYYILSHFVNTIKSYFVQGSYFVLLCSILKPSIIFSNT